MKKYIILILCFLPMLGMAQSDQALSLEEAIASAKKSHPMLKESELGLEKEKVLKSSAFDLGPTLVNYSRGELNSSVIDYEWEISQGIAFPTVYTAKSKLQKEKIEQAEIETRISEFELEYQVRKSWYQWAFADSYLNLVADMANLFEGFDQAAGKRFAAGETNILEKKTAETHFGQVILERNQADHDVAIAYAQIRKWIGKASDYQLPEDAFTALAFPETGLPIENHLFLASSGQSIAVAQAYQKVEKSALWPKFKVGYMQQQIEGVAGFSGVKLGIEIPLFFWPQASQIKSAGFEVMQQEATLDHMQMMLEGSQESKMQEVLKYFQAVQWIESNGLSLSEELLRFATKSFNSGEIDYIEYILHLQEAFQIKKSYLQAVQAYNQAVIDLQYLNGKFE